MRSGQDEGKRGYNRSQPMMEGKEEEEGQLPIVHINLAPGTRGYSRSAPFKVLSNLRRVLIEEAVDLAVEVGILLVDVRDLALVFPSGPLA